MKILVTGSEGQLGRELIRLSGRFGFAIFPVDLPELDITRPDQVEKTVSDLQPDLIVNAAAYTQVDRAEDEPERAYAVNRDGPEILARICKRKGLVLVHISTDYVFSGENKNGYRENDPVAPLSAYGRSKAAGEAVVRDRLEQHIILRTSWLYSICGNNFVKTMLRLAAEKPVIRVVDDQFGSPTCAADLAAAVFTLAQRIDQDGIIPWGTYHFCNRGVTNWYRFARQIIDEAVKMGLPTHPVIEPIPTDQYPVKAVRPKYSVLNCDRIRTTFGILPKPWEESLQETLERLYLDKSV